MMKIKLILPMRREGYISPHLQNEARKREIEPMPKEPGEMGWGERLWLFMVQMITKFLRWQPCKKK